MNNRFWYQVALGMGDGVILPFVVAAALAGAGLESIKVFNTSLAVLIAGTLLEAVSTALSSKEQHDQFNTENYSQPEIEREWKIEESRMAELGINMETRQQAHEEFIDEKKRWQSFIEDNELSAPPVKELHSLKGASIVGIAYFISGFVALHPFLISPDTQHNFKLGLGAVAVITFIVAILKSRINKERVFPLVLRTQIIALAAAMAAYLAGKAFD